MSPTSSDQLPIRCCTLKHCRRMGVDLPRRNSHIRRKDSRAHHYHIYESVSRSDAVRLSVCHVNALSRPRLAQLVAPTHVVISCKGRWTGSPRGKVNCDLSCWAAGQEGAV
ncbi:hypothetical protein GOODEAATRI_006565 [Goodea atripinnis]|uniref:Uncharacterized protein n=1 Tax=Goodea atripinnis TaxID=208336 RepID=A0ABV0MZ64_9TELE